MKKYWSQIDWAKTISIAVTAIVVVLVYTLFNHIGAIAGALGKVFYYFSSFFAGVIIAYILSPLSQWFQTTLFKRMRNRRSATALSVLLTYLVLFGVVGLLFSFAIPQLADSISTLASNLSGYFATFEKYLLNFSQLELVQHLGLDFDSFLNIAENIMDKIKVWLTENPNDIANAVVNVGSSLVNTIISLIISIYLLLDWKRFVFNFKRFFKALQCRKRHKLFRSFCSAHLLPLSHFYALRSVCFVPLLLRLLQGSSLLKQHFYQTFF